MQLDNLFDKHTNKEYEVDIKTIEGNTMVWLTGIVNENEDQELYISSEALQNLVDMVKHKGKK